MTRRKSVCIKWTLVLLVICSPSVCSRPQDSSPAAVISSTSNGLSESSENPLRELDQKSTEVRAQPESVSSSNTARDVKRKFPIQESIDTVASQLLEKQENASVNTPVVPDTRIPPKIKTGIYKHKIKTRNEDEIALYNGHAGEAVPVTMDEMESENKISQDTSESSTSNDGISTWVLLSNSPNMSSVSTEPTKIQDAQKKQKPQGNKNKTKRPQNNKSPIAKRPATIGSTNKADLVAGGSAINENVYNKLKDTVLTNVQKNKSTSTQRTTTTTVIPTTQMTTTKKEVTKSSTTVTTKKKKNKNKPKLTTTEEPISSESALLPMEPKEEEIELEISTPATTTKKPKRTTSRKKTKTKKRKTTPKPVETSLTEVKTTSNKTKSSKPGKKPIETGAITTQLYNYFSREVMPSVGVGMLGLASLVGIAGYFLYPFSTPVRRTFEVDKKDDIYKYNAEEYASEGNGQAEEEMLGTVLAGMPAHAKQKLNPYAGQTAHINRYQVKKDHDLRYRHVAGYEPNYNRYPQQKTGIAHAAVYAKPVNYGPQYETRHTYTTEGNKYSYEKPQTYTPYQAVEPIYAAPQTGSGISSYGNDDTSSSVVYGVKPSSESEFKPVYPFEAQFYSDSTSNPAVPTSMYLGSNNDGQEDELENSSITDDSNENKFVVGNVPKELVDTATPAVVPEHGPRKLKKRSISSSLEEILRAEKENKDIFISNEIDDFFSLPIRNLAPITEPLPINEGNKPKEVVPVYAVSVDPEQKPESLTTKTEIVESVSTLPINTEKNNPTADLSNDLETTTKTFRVYEVFSGDTTNPSKFTTNKESTKLVTSTQISNTETEDGESITETPSTLPTLPSVTEVPTSSPESTNNPDVITYPPLNESGGFLSFLRRLIDFKYRLGLSILQTTSDSLNRYLRNMENTMQKVAKASHKQ